MRSQPVIRDASDASVCRSCGACCAYSRDWPRFTLEEDSQIDLVPRMLVSSDGGGIRCVGDRCSALCGEVGHETSCAIYDIRPLVCRDCEPGDGACRTARRHFGLDPLEEVGALAADAISA